jgi:hypothetical protein
VQTHQINVSRARDMVQEIRHELFAFPEVLDVFVTSRPDSLVVVSRGRPRPGDWLRVLRALGYEVPPRRRRVTAIAERRRIQAAEAPGDVPAPKSAAWGSGRVSNRSPAVVLLHLGPPSVGCAATMTRTTTAHSRFGQIRRGSCDQS